MHSQVAATVSLTGPSYPQSRVFHVEAECLEVSELFHPVWVLSPWLGAGVESCQEYAPGFDWLGLYSRHTDKQSLSWVVHGIGNIDGQLQQSYIVPHP